MKHSDVKFPILETAEMQLVVDCATIVNWESCFHVWNTMVTSCFMLRRITAKSYKVDTKNCLPLHGPQLNALILLSDKLQWTGLATNLSNKSSLVCQTQRQSEPCLC